MWNFTWPIIALLIVGVMAMAAVAFDKWPVHHSKKLAALLVFAHPDDEAMFFVPMLAAMKFSFDFSFLCCSSGNADGLGKIRSKELVESGRIVGVPADRVEVIDRADLADGMKQHWDQQLIADIVSKHVKDHAIDVVFTFDAGGVSGHPNHTAVYRGVAAYALRSQAISHASPHGASSSASSQRSTSTARSTSATEPRHSVPCYKLETVPIYRKFIGALDVAVSWMLHAPSNPSFSSYPSSWPDRVMLVSFSLGTCNRMMLAHSSQYVWFRKLYLLFSRYTMVNTLVKIGEGDAAAVR